MYFKNKCDDTSIDVHRASILKLWHWHKYTLPYCHTNRKISLTLMSRDCVFILVWQATQQISPFLTVKATVWWRRNLKNSQIEFTFVNMRELQLCIIRSIIVALISESTHLVRQKEIYVSVLYFVKTCRVRTCIHTLAAWRRQCVNDNASGVILSM